MNREENEPSEPSRVDIEAYRRYAHKENRAIRRKEILTAAPKVTAMIFIAVALVAAIVFMTVQLLASRDATATTMNPPTLVVLVMAIAGAIIAVASIAAVIALPIATAKSLLGAIDNKAWIVSCSLGSFVGSLALTILVNALYLGIVFYR